MRLRLSQLTSPVAISYRPGRVGNPCTLLLSESRDLPTTRRRTRDLRPCRLAVAATVGLSVLLELLVVPAHATITSDLCTGNPCNITGTRIVTVPSNLDFGNVDVVFKTGAVLTLASGGATRSVEILAKSVTFEPASQVAGNGDNATVKITATGGDVTMQSSGSAVSRIDLSGLIGGYLTLNAAGRVVIDGLIDVSATGADAAAGLVDVVAGADVVIGRDIAAGAVGTFAFGGTIDIDAATGVAIGSPNGGALDTSGPGSGGAVTIFTSTGSITTSKKISADGGSPDGYGGSLAIVNSQGPITIGGALSSNGGSGSEFACGDGGDLTLDAGGAIAINADITVNGGTACGGGYIKAVAGKTFTQPQGVTIAAIGQGSGDYAGYGGTLDVVAGGNTVLRAITLTGNGGGGAADVRSTSGTISLAGPLNASNSGTITLEACSVNIASSPAGSADSRSAGTNTILASNSVTIAGQLLTGPAGGQNIIRMRSGAPTISGTVTPAPTVTVDPTIPACPPPPPLICPIAPAVCKQSVQSGKSTMLIKSDASNHVRDQLAWKWSAGGTTSKDEFGSPTTNTDYRLCLYDSSNTLISTVLVPAGGGCGLRPCWSESSSGFDYKNASQEPDGVVSVKLQAGSAGRAEVGLGGKGVLLPRPNLPISAPLTVQMHNSTGVCWGATYSGGSKTKNAVGIFKAKAD